MTKSCINENISIENAKSDSAQQRRWGPGQKYAWKGDFFVQGQPEFNHWYPI